MEFDHFVTQGMGSIEEALNGRVPGVMVRGYGVQKQAAMTGNIMIRGVSSRSKAEVKYVGSVAEDMELSADRAEAGKPDGASEEETLPEAPADLRTNLAETAFFYPQLRTNEQGEVSFSFTCLLYTSPSPRDRG